MNVKAISLERGMSLVGTKGSLATVRSVTIMASAVLVLLDTEEFGTVEKAYSHDESVEVK